MAEDPRSRASMDAMVAREKGACAEMGKPWRPKDRAAARKRARDAAIRFDQRKDGAEPLER